MHSKQISSKHSHEHAQLHKIFPSASLQGADLPEEPHWDNEGTVVLPLEVYSRVQLRCFRQNGQYRFTKYHRIDSGKKFRWNTSRIPLILAEHCLKQQSLCHHLTSTGTTCTLFCSVELEMWRCRWKFRPRTSRSEHLFLLPSLLTQESCIVMWEGRKEQLRLPHQAFPS